MQISTMVGVVQAMMFPVKLTQQNLNALFGSRKERYIQSLRKKETGPVMSPVVQFCRIMSRQSPSRGEQLKTQPQVLSLTIM
jgi:hypothetical protein